MQHYLDHMDRNSMAFGIENRSPFMDLELIKYFDTDIEKKLNGNFFKLELRNLFKVLTPLDTEKRNSKSGFSFGRDRFLIKNYKDILQLINDSKIIKKLIYIDKFLDQLNQKNILNKNNLIILSKLIVVAGIENQLINHK
jgi:hypothetical protein